MRQCAGAVALVTVGAESGRRSGLTVTSAGHFVFNFLNEKHALLALTFSGQKGVNGDDRFAFGRWTVGATGGPVQEDAVAAFDCVLTQELETKTPQPIRQAAEPARPPV